MALATFFRHVGSKYLTGAHYPAPAFGTIVEPCAGGAGYSVRYHRRRVILVERDPEVARVWRYLIGVSARELLALPDVPLDGSLDDVRCSDDARALIARNLNFASGPSKRFSAWRDEKRPGKKPGSKLDALWGPTLRARLAAQVEKIRHWTLIEGDYSKAPDVEATWFIDAPYQNMKSKIYRHDADAIDFRALAKFCRARRGQVIVCENSDARWLPFRPFGERMAAYRGTTKPDGVSQEVIWTNS